MWFIVLASPRPPKWYPFLRRIILSQTVVCCWAFSRFSVHKPYFGSEATGYWLSKGIASRMGQEGSYVGVWGVKIERQTRPFLQIFFPRFSGVFHAFNADPVPVLVSARLFFRLSCQDWRVGLTSNIEQSYWRVNSNSQVEQSIWTVNLSSQVEQSNQRVKSPKRDIIFRAWVPPFRLIRTPREIGKRKSLLHGLGF